MAIKTVFCMSMSSMVDCCKNFMLLEVLTYSMLCVCLCFYFFSKSFLQLNITEMFDANIDDFRWSVSGKYRFYSWFMWVHSWVFAVAVRNCSMLSSLQEHIRSKLNQLIIFVYFVYCPNNMMQYERAVNFNSSLAKCHQFHTLLWSPSV